MRALVIAVALSGCATTWIGTQATGTQKAWDEGVREETVPLPGVSERLNVKLTLGGTGQPFELGCSTDQRAKDVVYHSAFRYGKRWKLMTGLMFLAEGLLATAFLLPDAKNEKPQYWLYGGFFALDAAVTGAIFFIPRKEIYRTDEVPTLTHVRSDCPDGMTLAIGSDRFPVDAAGRIGEVGEAALDAWMTQPTGPLVVEAVGQARTFDVGPAERCLWQREHATQPTNCYAGVVLRSLLVSIEVPAGTLSTVAAQ